MTKAADLSKTGSLVNSSGQIDLTTGVTGVLPVANGGTGSSSGVSPGGSTTQVQYNNAGAFGGDSGFVYSGGNVGIGTTTNLGKLAVQGTIAAKATADESILSISHNGSEAVISASYGNTGSYDPMVFKTSDAERMRIASSGNVGIGSTGVASSRLDVDQTGFSYFLTSTNGSRNYGLAVDGTSWALVDRTVSAYRMIVDSSGNFKFNSGYGDAATAYGCRAWVNFNGESTVAIRRSGNVSSITDNGTGDYSVNFTTAMPDADYAATMSAAHSAGALSTFMSVYAASTTYLRVRNYNAGGSLYDDNTISVVIQR